MNRYPQTSCPSSNCPPTRKYNLEENNIWPSSIAVPACSNVFEQSETVVHQSIQPSQNGGPKILNQIGPQLDSKWYIPVQSNISGQCQVSYAGFNPILMNAPRAQRMLLDRPHLSGEMEVGNVPRDQIYTKCISNYGKNYTNYNDITGGDIQYWISNTDAYSEPVFTTPSLVNTVIYTDPMGVIRPEYRRLSSAQYDWDKCDQDQCDSFTHDTLEFRQELIEKQMRKRNEQEYQYRWTSK